MAEVASASIADRLHRRVHGRLVFDRRLDRLSTAILALLPSAPATVLDVGCGSGQIGSALADAGHCVVGVETLARPECAIPVIRFDGRAIPVADSSVDHAVVVDVLHHATDAAAVLAEARRVSRGSVIVKDHFAENARQRLTLGAMDWVGNRQFGVGRDGAYRSRAEWAELWAGVGLSLDRIEESLDLYPRPVKPLFERGLHFVARLVRDPRVERLR